MSNFFFFMICRYFIIFSLLSVWRFFKIWFIIMIIIKRIFYRFAVISFWTGFSFISFIIVIIILTICFVFSWFWWSWSWLISGMIFFFLFLSKFYSRFCGYVLKGDNLMIFFFFRFCSFVYINKNYYEGR